MIAEDLARQMNAAPGPAIVAAQAGQINTGAFDPFEDIVRITRAAGAWLHVDGAFGLWARTHPNYRNLTQGVDAADSWSVDGHKWLQTPFDCGYAIVRDTAALQAAMRVDASYLPAQAEGERIPCSLVPELSRRARGIPTWAMLKSLGRQGVEAMVARHCGIAKRIAEQLAAADGVRVLNEVVLNQVAVSFGFPGISSEERKDATEAVIAALRESGEIYVGGGRWHGEWVMRISVICDATRPADADAVADLVLAAWTEVQRTVNSGGK